MSIFALKTIIKSKLVSFRTELKLYKVMIRPIALYACETWATAITDGQSLARFQKKILRKIFGPETMSEHSRGTN